MFINRCYYKISKRCPCPNKITKSIIRDANYLIKTALQRPMFTGIPESLVAQE